MLFVGDEMTEKGNGGPGMALVGGGPGDTEFEAGVAENLFLLQDLADAWLDLTFEAHRPEDRVRAISRRTTAERQLEECARGLALSLKAERSRAGGDAA